MKIGPNTVEFSEKKLKFPTPTKIYTLISQLKLILIYINNHIKIINI